MRVLLVSPLPPPSGGIATWTKEVLDYFEQNNCEKTLQIEVVNTALTGKRSTVVSDKRSYFEEIVRSSRIFRAIRCAFKKSWPDVIHINSSGAQFGMIRDALIAHYANVRKVGVVVHFRCNVKDQAEYNRISKFGYRRLTKFADRIFVLNRQSYNYVYRTSSENVEIVPNFSSIEIRSNEKEIRSNLRKVAFVGQVRKSKGVSELLLAAVSFPDIEFHLYGNIYDEYKDLTVSNNVMIHGSITKDELITALDESDLFILPSYTEGFSNALVEALARGVPCIASDVGANREMLADDSGICVPPKDPTAIIDAIEKMRSVRTRTLFSNNAIRKCIAQYSKESVCETLSEKWIKVAVQKSET